MKQVFFTIMLSHVVRSAVRAEPTRSKIDTSWRKFTTFRICLKSLGSDGEGKSVNPFLKVGSGCTSVQPQQMASKLLCVERDIAAEFERVPKLVTALSQTKLARFVYARHHIHFLFSSCLLWIHAFSCLSFTNSPPRSSFFLFGHISFSFPFFNFSTTFIVFSKFCPLYMNLIWHRHF